MVLEIIIIFICTLAFTYYTAKIDDVLQEKEQYVLKEDKSIRFYQRLFFVLSICCGDVLLGILAGLVFNLTFDQIKNKIGKTKFPLFYLGTESEFDSFYTSKKFLYYSQKTITILLIAGVIYFKIK